MSRASEIMLRRNLQQAKAREEKAKKDAEIRRKRKEAAEKNKG